MKHALALLALLVALAACGQPASAPPPSGPSVYALSLSLRDASDQPIALDTFRGHPVLVSMFYGSCPSACPLIVAHMKEVESQLPPDVRARTRLLLVSFDAEHDTPDALARIAERHRVDARWKFAVGADDEVRQLANALGVVYRREQGGAFSHNSVITALDGDGRVVARVDDPLADLAPLAKAVASAR
ncbi:MAG TPA: SCO family protein [Labilithrix sp.]